jgi:hypothetical protein
MKDPRTTGRTRFSTLPPPTIEQLRAAVIARVGHPAHSANARASLVAHIDALSAGRPTVSPAGTRGGTPKAGPPGSFGLPD